MALSRAIAEQTNMTWAFCCCCLLCVYLSSFERRVLAVLPADGRRKLRHIPVRRRHVCAGQLHDPETPRWNVRSQHWVREWRLPRWEVLQRVHERVHSLRRQGRLQQLQRPLLRGDPRRLVHVHLHNHHQNYYHSHNLKHVHEHVINHEHEHVFNFHYLPGVRRGVPQRLVAARCQTAHAEPLRGLQPLQRVHPRG